jgi:carbonic anhydrase
MAFNESVIYFVTLSAVVFINLLWGIGIGFALALALLIYKMSRFQVKIINEGSPIRIVVTGSLTFLGIPSLLKQLEALPAGKTLQLFLEIDHLDHATLEAIRSWKDGYEKNGGHVIKAPLDQIWKSLNAGSFEGS